MANERMNNGKKFYGPRKWRYGIVMVDPGRTNQGFWLRRLMADHNTPAVRLPRELVRWLKWNQGDLLFIVPDGDMIVIGKLKYEDPKEVAHDKADEVRRKYGFNRSADDSAGGA